MNVSDMFTYVKSSEGKVICTSFVYESSLDLRLAPNVSKCVPEDAIFKGQMRCRKICRRSVLAFVFTVLLPQRKKKESNFSYTITEAFWVIKTWVLSNSCGH